MKVSLLHSYLATFKFAANIKCEPNEAYLACDNAHMARAVALGQMKAMQVAPTMAH